MKKKKTPDNILATVKQPPPKAEEADQEQCGSDTKKKIE